jgi:hypothetical protein
VGVCGFHIERSTRLRYGCSVEAVVDAGDDFASFNVLVVRDHHLGDVTGNLRADGNVVCLGIGIVGLD